MRDEQVGSYRITQKLAQGGMGEVYLAQHDLMDREAVVKVLHPKLLHDPEVVRRFLNEARAAASIQHPGIVAIYEMGQEGGQVYIVMERLRGETLAERIAREPVEVEDAVTMSRQLASALAAAHELAIVHRDLKPDNIFVVPDPDMPGGERIKILDFGVAKLAPTTPGEGGMTAQGSIFGTPAYMAPEQCENAARVDARTDLYALGCILYEMLCGRPPFGKGGLELLAAHLRDEPAPPSRFNPRIPGELEDIILRLLEKKPEHRVQNCEELLHLLGTADLTPRSAPLAPPPRDDLAFAATVAPNSQPPMDSLANPAEARASRISAPDIRASRASAPDIRASRASAPGIRASRASAPGIVDIPRAMQVVSPTPTTHRHATGQLDGHTAPVYRRRSWLWIPVLLVVAAGGGAAAMLMSQRSLDDSAGKGTDSELASAAATTGDPVEAAVDPARVKLEQAEKSLADMEWVEAIIAAREVTDKAPEGSDAHKRALEIQELAKQGQTYALTFDSFLNAVKKQDVGTAVYIYAQLPENSVFHDKADEAYRAMRATWMAPRLDKARELVAKGRCKQLGPIAARVGFMFPESQRDIEKLAETCGTKGATASATGEADATGATGEADGKAGEQDGKQGDTAGTTGETAGETGDKTGTPEDGTKTAGEDGGKQNQGEDKPAEPAVDENLPDKVSNLEIRKKLRPVRKDLMKCYDKAKLSGRVVVNFKISLPGRAGMVTSDPEEAGEGFRRCVWNTLRTIDFSRAKTVTDGSYPLGKNSRKKRRKPRRRRR